MQQFKYVNVLRTFRIKIPPTSLLQDVAFKLVIGVDGMYVHFFIPALLISPVVFLSFWSSRFGPYWASSQLPCPDSSALEIAHPSS